ncbi:N-6 DNA methylase, partial [bacterium]|nr:N-6 DNA methylase [bacterium]
AVVVPEGLLFGSTKAHKELRQKLIENYELLAVISLPAGIFKPYAGVKTGVIVFRRPQNGDKEIKTNGKVWFFEVKNDGFDPDKIVGGGRPETPEQNDIPELLRQWKIYRESGFKNPPGVEAGSVLEPGSDEPHSWWAEKENIEENDCNLAAGIYKPNIAEPPPNDDPVELIREVMATEREISIGLEKLLRNVEEDG